MQDIPFIDVQSLSKHVEIGQESLTILTDISFQVQAGATLAIVGASGSGKSTLLSLLAGLDLPTKGSINIDGQCISSLDENQRAALRLRLIGFVFQSFLLLPKLNVLENVMLPCELQGGREARLRAQQLLTDVGLEHRMSYFPSQLSGGEQQRVAIARAFVTQPKLLLADEPTGNLDEVTGHRVGDLLFNLNQQQGTTLIIVTHDLSIAARCQNQLTLASGQIQESSRL